ncbi:hypothetical protein I6N90_03310 [Paenibacillus sp. GSMTC-2017]|uniref:hypothetical protein n=1 Tax=Paenibacillus sp. GSMTC-2017 TaxID=2794350 RepID=UPI0018D69F12|nr:hypothetical protein [Paenibacillus sp. GSMTC-2017]MBH5316838.1 hypothetical protein [Paenibacillus sp. GSMTC-2017]
MKLKMNIYPYRLEQDNPITYATLADLILAFQEQGTDILFNYTNWDRELDPYKGDLIEESIHNFHNDLISDPDESISQAVKEVLLHHYAPERNPKDNQAVMDQLLTHFREVPLDELNEELLLKIGTVVYTKQSIYTLEDRDEVTQAFVNNRLVYTNKTWLFPHDRPVYLKNVLWYRANTKEEIIQSFELTGSWFICVIVSPNTAVEDYSYFLEYSEDHGDEHDGMVLFISTSTPDNFKKNVLPRLKNVIGDEFKIVE